MIVPEFYLIFDRICYYFVIFISIFTGPPPPYAQRRWRRWRGSSLLVQIVMKFMVSNLCWIDSSWRDCLDWMLPYAAKRWFTGSCTRKSERVSAFVGSIIVWSFISLVSKRDLHSMSESSSKTLMRFSRVRSLSTVVYCVFHWPFSRLQNLEWQISSACSWMEHIWIIIGCA